MSQSTTAETHSTSLLEKQKAKLTSAQTWLIHKAHVWTRTDGFHHDFPPSNHVEELNDTTTPPAPPQDEVATDVDQNTTPAATIIPPSQAVPKKEASFGLQRFKTRVENMVTHLPKLGSQNESSLATSANLDGGEKSESTGSQPQPSQPIQEPSNEANANEAAKEIDSRSDDRTNLFPGQKLLDGLRRRVSMLGSDHKTQEIPATHGQDQNGEKKASVKPVPEAAAAAAAAEATVEDPAPTTRLAKRKSLFPGWRLKKSTEPSVKDDEKVVSHEPIGIQDNQTTDGDPLVSDANHQQASLPPPPPVEKDVEPKTVQDKVDQTSGEGVKSAVNEENKESSAPTIKENLDNASLVQQQEGGTAMDSTNQASDVSAASADRPKSTPATPQMLDEKSINWLPGVKLLKRRFSAIVVPIIHEETGQEKEGTLSTGPEPKKKLFLFFKKPVPVKEKQTEQPKEQTSTEV